MNKFIVISERGKMLIEHQYTTNHIGKGGNLTVWNECWEVEVNLSSRSAYVPSFMIVAKATTDEWYYGSYHRFTSIVVREGTYEYDADADNLKIIEEKPINYRLPGNGEGRVVAYTKEAAEYLEGVQWPNGRKCYYVERAF